MQGGREILTAQQGLPSRCFLGPDLESTDTNVSEFIHDLVSASALRTPEAVALVHEGGSVSYGELEASSNRLAHHLRALGAGPEVVVAICLDRGPEMVVALLAILKSGAAYLPLDPEYPSARMSFMLEDANASLLVTTSSIEKVISAPLVRMVLLDQQDEIAQRPDTLPSINLHPLNAAYVLFTSGSTGHPKSVVGTHQCVGSRLRWVEPFMAPDDVYLFKNSPNLIDALWEIFMPLVRGQKVVIASGDECTSVRGLLSVAGREGVTRVVLVPTLLRALLSEPLARAKGLARLRYCASTGEALPRGTLEEFRRHFPGVCVANVYGTTEFWDATGCILKTVDDGAAAPIGWEAPSMTVLILDAQMRPCPEGEVGEIYVGGPGLARGYAAKPGLTAQRFVPSPLGQGERLYRTGDLGRLDNQGCIEFVGRADRQISLNGHRIELDEVEAAVLSCPGVVDAAVVVASTDSGAGDGGGRLVCFFVPAPAPDGTDADGVEREIAKILPRAMVPASFHRLDALPKTTTGKVDRRGLQARSVEPQYAAYVAPKTETEALLVTLWQELLGLPRIGREDNFFALGGHSLLGMQLIVRVVDVAGEGFELSDLFGNPQLAKMAEAVDSARERRDIHDAAVRDDLMIRIDSMSESEILAMLDKG